MATWRPTSRSRSPTTQVQGQSVAQVVNSLGYAYATTSYRANGLVADGRLSTSRSWSRKYGAGSPRTRRGRYIVGVSEGGLVAALAAEQRPDLFDGGAGRLRPGG